MSQKTIKVLNKLLGDTYVLYFKAHTFHWNIKGPHFPSYHLLLEKHYEELFEKVDMIAERIRALDHPTPPNLKVCF